MVMTKEDIVSEYRMAKSKQKQIGILADQNICTKREIVEILQEAGETLPGNFGPRTKLKAVPAAAEQPEAGTEQPDQRAKRDAGKPRLSMVPSEIIRCIAWVREYGNQKYGDPDNWKTVSVERYRDAAYRHLLDYIDDPVGVDEESGLPHLWHLACNIDFLCTLEKDKYKINIHGGGGKAQ